MADDRIDIPSSAGYTGRDRRGPGVFRTDRLDWSEDLSMNAAWRRIPVPERTSVEVAAGRPFHTWFASASKQHWHYTAAGPEGFCSMWGILLDGRWSLTRLRRPVVPAEARWFAEVALPPPSRRELDQLGASSSGLDPFAALDETFVQGFGMFPERTQTFFAEPFDADPPSCGHSYWVSEWEAGVITFQVWSYAAAESSIAIAYGWRRTRVRFDPASWDDALGALVRVPMNVRATWWMEPRPPRNPSTAYSVLGLGRDASDAEIRASYRQLARTFHPDTATGSSVANAQRFHQIHEAWKAVGSPAARSAYDVSLSRLRELPASSGRPGWWVDSDASRAR